MPDHKKPTAEELEEGVKKALEEIEKEEDTPDPDNPPKEDTPVVADPPTDDDKGDDDNGEDEVEEDNPPVDTKPPVKEEDKEDKKTTPPSTEERYKESTREAQRLYRNNAEMNKAIEEANNLPEPTEDELKDKFSEWDEMSANERIFAKETLINQRFRAHINEASTKQREIDKWGERVGKFVEDPKTLVDMPELEGKQEKFKEYVMKDNKLVGTDFGVLVSAFLHDYEKNKPAPKKGQMMPSGTAGPSDKPKQKSDELTPEQGRQLRQTDYKKYVEYLRAGKISTDTV